MRMPHAYLAVAQDEHTVMACRVMAYIATNCTVAMACIVIAFIVVAYTAAVHRAMAYGAYDYDLYSSGLHRLWPM